MSSHEESEECRVEELRRASADSSKADGAGEAPEQSMLGIARQKTEDMAHEAGEKIMGIMHSAKESIISAFGRSKRDDPI